MKCKICNSISKKLYQVKVMDRYQSNLSHCNNCDYLFLENPFWLNEAYKEPINISDTGIMDRNINLAAKLSVLIYFFFDKKKSFLDASGGYGILTRLMRDHGFDFYWSDKYCENILAKGFESEKNNIENFELITLFEVFTSKISAKVFIPLEFAIFAKFFAGSIPRTSLSLLILSLIHI